MTRTHNARLANIAFLGAIFFAVGSALLARLLLRGRMIPPQALTRLGVLASALLEAVLPLDVAGLPGPSLGRSASLT